jgi:thymidine kinase
LLRRIKRYVIAKKKVLCIKYAGDTRYSKECIATHEQEFMIATPCWKLKECENFIDKYDCIGIDEGQFVKSLFFKS